MTPVPETPSGWLGSTERSEALKLAAARGMAARATGLLDGELTEELRASFERTTQQVTRYLNVPVGLFSLLEGDCQMIVARSGPEIPEILPAEGSMCIHVRDSGRDVIIDDLTRHELGDGASNMTSAGANAYMGTPVFSSDGQPIGSLCAIDFPSRAWEPNDLDLLRSLAEGLTDKIALIEAKARAEASEARLSATIAAIPNVVYVFEPDGRIGYVSPQVKTLYGLAPESLMGLGYRRHLRHEDARRLIMGMRARRHEPTSFSQEVCLRDASGTERELLASGQPFRDADGAVGYIVSTTEIGHLRDAERALAVERGRLEALLEALPHIVVLSNPESGVEYVSPQSQAILGYAPESLLGFGMYDLLFHPDDRATLRDRRRGWLAAPQAFEHEFRAIHADGRQIPMSMRGFPLPVREGVAHSHVVTFTDLGAIRAAEALVTAERRASDDRLRTIFDTMPILTALIDLGGRITFVNETALRAAGIAPEDAVGKIAWETPFVAGNPEATAKLRDVIERGLAGESLQTEIVFTFQGQRFETLYYARPIVDDAGAVTALSVSAVDVTEVNVARDRVEAEREEMASRTQTMLDAMPLWVGLVSPEGRLLAVNRAPVEAAGKTVEGVLGTVVWEEWTAGDEETTRILRDIIGRAAGGERVTQEMAYRWNGAMIETEYHAVPIHDAEGTVTMIATSALDVTERNAARRRAESEGELMRQILGNSPILKALCDCEGRVLFANDALLQATGTSLDEVRGHALWETTWAVESGLTDAIQAASRRAIAGETAFADLAYASPDHGLVELEWRVAPIYGTDGELAYVFSTALDVTVRNRAQRDVEAERSLLQQVIGNTPVMMALLDRDARILFANEAPLRALGLTLDDIRGQVHHEVPWTNDPGVNELFLEAWRVAATGEVNRSEFSFVDVNGTEHEMEHQMVPIRDDSGEIQSYLVSAMDVTERNQARRAAEAEGDRFRQVLDNMPLFASLSDPQGRLLFLNAAPIRSFGLNPDAVRGRLMWEIVATMGEEFPALFRDAFERCVDGEEIRQEFTVKTADGGAIDVEHRMDAIRDDEGRIVSVLSTAMDVTARNQALQSAEAERTRLETVIEILPSGILIANAKGRVTESNPEAVALFGEQAEEGSPDAWPPGFIIEADGTETPFTKETVPLERALRGETVREARTIRIVTPDGENRWLKCDAVPIRDADGNLDGAVMNALDITDLELARRETERERTESFARMERVIASLPINVVLADKEGHLLYANEAPLRGAGITLEDVIGKIAWESVWMPDEATARITKEEYQKAAAGEVARREFSIRMGDTIIDIDHSVVPIFDADGQVEFLLPSSIDVTERNRALRRAQDEERRLSETVEEMPVGLFVFDREMRLLQANEEAIKATGMTPERLNSGYLPRMWFIEPDGSETEVGYHEAPSWRALQGGDGRENRPLRLHHEGTAPEDDLYIRLEAAPLTDAEGAIVGAIVTAVDVKPLLEAEKALAREQGAATERLMTTLEGIAGFVWLLDLDGKIVWCNRSFLDAMGLTFEEVDGSQFWTGSWVAHDPEMAMRLGEATCETAGGEASFFPVTAQAVTGIIDVDISLTPVRDREGAVKYLVASGIEVTARNQAIRQIEDARMSAERARELAERATRAKDEFLAVLSHELRTPLTPAMLGLELLTGDLDEALLSVTDTELTASINETMGSVRSNLEIQVRLIDDLLDVTRIARGKLELRKSPIDVHDAARHALTIVAPAAEEKGITIAMSPEATRTMVSADPARLRQILWNLLANAVKFTNPGGHIRVETENAGRGTVRLKVIDDGLGIDQERLATIFDAFDQGDGTVSRGFGGLGLGLAIARSLARAHGGTLWATSAGKGHGATFVLDLPTIEQREVTAEIAALESIPRTHMGCRVLLVEDNLDTARFTAALLRRAEVEVVVAHSVEAALREGVALREAGGTWSAILTDIGLPDGDGIEVVRRLRAAGVEAPAIAMSGYGRDEDKARTADAGFRSHLVKPVVFERLLEVLNEVLPGDRAD